MGGHQSSLQRGTGLGVRRCRAGHGLGSIARLRQKKPKDFYLPELAWLGRLLLGKTPLTA